jgi:selenocysteine lyase/cysteine desulfurase
VVVDAVHGAPHLPLDVQTLGADAVAFSTYKLFGPNCGVLWLAPDLFKGLDPFRVEPHQDPETRLEWGTLSNTVVAGVTACLEYLLRLGERLEPAFVGQLRDYPRERRRLKIALETARAYEAEVSRQVLSGLAGGAVQLFGVTDPERVAERVPTFAFAASAPDMDVERALWEIGRLQVAAGSHYSAAVTRGLGRSSVVRASFAHYNNSEEAAAFVQGVSAL